MENRKSSPAWSVRNVFELIVILLYYTPHRLARLHVQENDLGVVKVFTYNVLSYSLNRQLHDCTEVHIGNSIICLTSERDSLVWFNTLDRMSWEVREYPHFLL